jgi:hypothetical protein
MCTRTSQIAPHTAQDALGMMQTALNYLSEADLGELGTAGQAEALTELAKITARTSAVQAAALAVFDAAGGPEEAGCQGVASWLARQTQVTKGAARGAAKWSRSLAAHPAVASALAAGEVSESFARQVIDWTGKLPDHMRDGSDKILLEAAARGCGIRELQIVAGKLWETHKASQPDEDETDDRFAGRGVRLNTTFNGAGQLTGDLTPQCATALQAALDALGKKRGAEDDRTLAQRQHDALEEALSILLRARELPDLAGTGTVCQVMIPFSELRDLPGASALENAWLHATPGEPAYLTGKDAETASCDAALIPVVTGHPDWQVIDKIVEVVLQAHQATARSLTADEWAALLQAIAGYALDFVSGPRGAAAMLRAALVNGHQSQVPLSYPLDIGYSESVPAWMRKAIIVRDRHCQWPGGCDQPRISHHP